MRGRRGGRGAHRVGSGRVLTKGMPDPTCGRWKPWRETDAHLAKPAWRPPVRALRIPASSLPQVRHCRHHGAAPARHRRAPSGRAQRHRAADHPLRLADLAAVPRPGVGCCQCCTLGAPGDQAGLCRSAPSNPLRRRQATSPSRPRPPAGQSLLHSCGQPAQHPDRRAVPR